jgi:hypothetical protein
LAPLFLLQGHADPADRAQAGTLLSRKMRSKANLTKLAFCGIFAFTSKDLAMAVIRNSSA